MYRLMFCKCLTDTSQKWKILQEMNVVNVKRLICDGINWFKTRCS